MKKYRRIVLTPLLFLMASTGFAQTVTDKNYLNGIVRISGFWISISLEGKPFEEVKNTCKVNLDYTCAMAVVSKMEEDGWEITSTQAIEGYIYYFLRKKK